MTFQVIIDFLILILMGAAAWGFGTAFLRLLKISSIACGEDIFRISVGLGILAHLVLGLGIIFPLIPGLAWGLLGAGGILFIATLFLEKDRLFRRPHLPQLDWTEIILLVLVIFNSLFPLVRNGLLPPIHYDEAAYHLAVPQIFIQQGYISYISFIPYANWPLEAEMLYLLGLLTGSETLAHLISWGTMILINMGLVVFAKHFFSRRAGLVAAMIFSATPMVASIAGTALVELPLTLFAFLAFVSFFLWIQTREPRIWILSALLAGLAASTKFNAAVIAGILGLLVAGVSLYQKDGPKKSFLRFVGFGSIAFLVVSVWYLKSWLQTGNPLFSFFLEIFPTRNWDALGSTYLLDFIQKPNVALSVQNFFYAFWLISSDYARIGPFSFRLGYLYLLGIPLTALAFWKETVVARGWLVWLAIVSAILYLNWYLQTHQARFFMIAAPLMALTVGAAVARLMEWKGLISRIGVLGGLIIVVVLNSWVVQPTEIALLRSNKPYLLGQQNRSQYLSAHVNSYDVFTYANSHLPGNAYVLMALFEARGYYLNRQYTWLNPISQRAIKLETYQNDTQLAADLDRMGITHIIFNIKDSAQFDYIEYGVYDAQLILQLLQNHARLQYAYGDLELFEFIPGANGGPTQ